MARTCNILRAFGLQIDAMASFSDDFAFVLFCFVFVFILSLKPQPLPWFNRSSTCRRPDSHTRFFLFPFCLFGGVACSKYFCTISVFSLYGEYVVRSFLPEMVFFYLVTRAGCLTSYFMREIDQFKSTKQYNKRFCLCSLLRYV